jgi:hypothetical protein
MFHITRSARAILSCAGMFLGAHPRTLCNGEQLTPALNQLPRALVRVEPGILNAGRRMAAVTGILHGGGRRVPP